MKIFDSLMTKLGIHIGGPSINHLMEKAEEYDMEVDDVQYIMDGIRETVKNSAEVGSYIGYLIGAATTTAVILISKGLKK